MMFWLFNILFFVATYELSKLPTLLHQYIWIKNGDWVLQTVEYLTSLGIVGLTGDRDSFFLDYDKIRHMESKLVITSGTKKCIE